MAVGRVQLDSSANKLVSNSQNCALFYCDKPSSKSCIGETFLTEITFLVLRRPQLINNDSHRLSFSIYRRRYINKTTNFSMQTFLKNPPHRATRDFCSMHFVSESSSKPNRKSFCFRNITPLLLSLPSYQKDQPKGNCN